MVNFVNDKSNEVQLELCRCQQFCHKYLIQGTWFAFHQVLEVSNYALKKLSNAIKKLQFIFNYMIKITFKKIFD